MKLLKSFGLMALLAITVVACSKKDSGGAAGTFTYDSKSYSLSNGYFFDYGTDGGDLSMISTSYENAITNNAKMNGISIEFVDSTIKEGTFTLKSQYDADFDKTKNFYGASVGIDITAYTNATAEIASGSVTIAKNGSGYSVSFDMIDENNKAVKGSFSGSVQTY